jgi:NAD(P)-dependent dehydrogenase (short-subunit alcohol dehydrogenase family)
MAVVKADDPVADPSTPLNGKIAWVTGGASGIGLAIVHRLRSMGANVAILDARQPNIFPTAETVHICDVASRSSVDSVSAQLESLFGPPYVLVNSAGIAAGSMVADHDPAVWDRMIAVNLTGTFNIVRRAFPMMAAVGSGRIILLSSDSAFMGAAGSGAYSASKAGVVAFGRAVATEGGPLGINCNILSPGTVDTPMTRAHFGSREALTLAAEVGNVLRVVLDPEDLAAATAFLCLPDSRYITGQVLHVNAGSIMR